MGKRPKYTSRKRVGWYLRWYLDVGIMHFFAGLTGQNARHPLNGRPPFPGLGATISLFENLRETYTTILAFIWLALLVQMTLVLSDFLYCTFHIVQHKFRSMHKLSGHSYHHNFQYPLAMCGPWLAPLDLILSGIVTFGRPVSLLLDKSYVFARVPHYSPLYSASFLLDSMLWGYIHEMNDYDHCGKQCPSWSGFPLCPPLGFKFGFHKSIPNHEAHHNFSNCGFGLLGIADRCYGTYSEPACGDTNAAKEQ